MIKLKIFSLLPPLLSIVALHILKDAIEWFLILSMRATYHTVTIDFKKLRENEDNKKQVSHGGSDHNRPVRCNAIG